MERIFRVFPVPVDCDLELYLAGEQCRTFIRQQTVYQVSVICINKKKQKQVIKFVFMLRVHVGEVKLLSDSRKIKLRTRNVFKL